MTDLQQLKQQLDLLNIAQQAGTQLRKVALTGGGEWAGPCPFCGGRDRFRVQPHHENGGIWLCRHCTDGKWQDAISFIMRQKNCDFKTALRVLTAACTPTRDVVHTAMPTAAPQPNSPPTQEWQIAARKVIDQCVMTLWSNAGVKARTWLHARGLKDESIKQWQIGYLPGAPTDWRHICGLSVPTGIVIPCLTDNVIWYLKVRRAGGIHKYVQVKGGKQALYGATMLRHMDDAVLCEGEFDVVLLHQEAGDVVGTATLGSASVHLDIGNWAAYLLPVTRLWISYDADHAGEIGADKWIGMTARARRMAIPCLQPGAKDLTDFHLAGGNLRDLVTQAITGTDTFVDAIMAWGRTKGYQPALSASGHIVMHKDAEHEMR